VDDEEVETTVELAGTVVSVVFAEPYAGVAVLT
jgi:hypothetical protein